MGNDKVSTEAWTFISYKRADTDAVRALATNLEVGFGDDHVFFDLADIHGGDRWEALIQSEVLKSHVVIAAITKSWLNEIERRLDQGQDYVVFELATAIRNGVPVLPVIFPDVDLPVPDALPEPIRDLAAFQAVQLTHLHWDRDVELLTQRICEIASQTGGGGRADRERKARIAKSVAKWLSIDGQSERVLMKTCGAKDEDAVLLVTESGTWVDRSVTSDSPGWLIPHDRLAAFCRHKDDVWLLEPDAEHHVRRLPQREIDQLEQLLRNQAPDVRIYRKAPDQQVRDGLIVFSRHSLATQRGIDLSWVNSIKFSAEEELILAALKIGMMEKDFAADPDISDRVAKRKGIETYVEAVVTSYKSGEDAVEAPKSIKDVRRCIGKDEWGVQFRRYLGSLDPEDARPLFTDGEVLARMLDQVTGRDRALLVLIELAAFYPWGGEVKFEKGVREEALERIVTRIPADIDHDYFRQVEGSLAKRKKALAGSERNWGKIAAFAGGAAVLGVITAGAAAPVIGTAIGGMMGLSGAAATSAGLAFLGGGSLAAGGLGMAGGTALVTVLGGAVGAAVGAKTSNLTKEEVLVESAKLDVTSEYVFLREHGATSQVSSIIDVLDAELEEWQKEIDVAKERQEAPDEESLVDKAKGVVRRKATELDELLERSKIVERLRSDLDRQLNEFVTNVNEWIDDVDPIVEQVKASALPSAVVAVRVAEGALRGADRLAHVLPAMIAKEDGEPVLNVFMRVVEGRDQTSGKDALRKIGVTHPLALGAGGGTIDVVGHPLIWASAASVLAVAHGATAIGSHLVQAASSGELAVALLPLARLNDTLESAGLDAHQTGKAIAELIDRKLKSTLGGAAIEIAEGLRLTLIEESVSEAGDYRL